MSRKIWFKKVNLYLIHSKMNKIIMKINKFLKIINSLTTIKFNKKRMEILKSKLKSTYRKTCMKKIQFKANNLSHTSYKFVSNRETLSWKSNTPLIIMKMKMKRKSKLIIYRVRMETKSYFKTI